MQLGLKHALEQLPGHTSQLLDAYNMNPDVEPYESVWDAILLYRHVTMQHHNMR